MRSTSLNFKVFFLLGIIALPVAVFAAKKTPCREIFVRLATAHYVEPSDAELIAEINNEILGEYGGEYSKSSDVHHAVQAIADEILKTQGLNPADYTVHVLASKYEANMFASPGNHIWVTRAALEGTRYERVLVMDWNSSHIKEEPKIVEFFSEVESIPLGIAHEIGHEINGDVARHLKNYRRSRKESVTGENSAGRSWLSIANSELPGGKTYRMEQRADKFAIAAAEDAGFSTKAATKTWLDSRDVWSTGHPATAQRGWAAGVRSARNGGTKDELLNPVRVYREYLYLFDESPIDPLPIAEFKNSWEALDRLPIHYRAHFQTRRDEKKLKTLQETYQQNLLSILNGKLEIPDIEFLARKLRQGMWEYQSTLRAGPSTQGLNPPLNEHTKFSREIEKSVLLIIKKLNPEFNGQVYLSSISTIVDALSEGVAKHYFNEYEAKRLTYTDYLQKVLTLGVFNKGTLLNEGFKIAHTPNEVADAYHLIVRMGGRDWRHTDEVKLQNPKDAAKRWLQTEYVVGSSYELLERQLWEGSHFSEFARRGIFSDPSDPRQVLVDYLNVIARDDSPLFRSAETWPVGDVAGFLKLFPTLQEDPKSLKELLDEVSRDHFRGKPNLKTYQQPFSNLFCLTMQCLGKYKGSWDEKLVFDLGIHTRQQVGGDNFSSIKYSPSKAKKYFLAPEGSLEEQAALHGMLVELNKTRESANENLLRSYYLEHHFMEAHPLKTFGKKVKLLEAVIKSGASTKDLKIFSETGTLDPKYRVEDHFVHDEKEKAFYLEYYGNPYAHYENPYEAAIGTVYQAITTAEDAEYLLTHFDLEKAPLLKWEIEASRFHLLRNALDGARNLKDALKELDHYFSAENPFRWIAFDQAWNRFRDKMTASEFEAVLSALPNLNLYQGGTERDNTARNVSLIHSMFDNLQPRSFKDWAENNLGYDQSFFYILLQTLEREVYESANSAGLLSNDPKVRLDQAKRLFRSSSESGVSHPALDRIRIAYMRTLPIDSAGYQEIRDKLTDPEIIAEASMPFLKRALAAEPQATHDRQRDLIRKNLKVGSARDRFLDEHLARAKGLTELELQYYAKMKSDHPKSEKRSAVHKALEMGDFMGLEAAKKMKFVRFFLTRGNRQELGKFDRREQELFLRTANYLFERHEDDQLAFLHHLFMGEKSILTSSAAETQLVNDVFLAGEGKLPREQRHFLTALYDSLYKSLDDWDAGQLLAELILESQVKKPGDAFVPPAHSPERAVRILRLMTGFGPKGAQMLRGHRAILGDSPEADRYRNAFEGFEEKAQEVDLLEGVKTVEKAFGRPFHSIFKSVDGVLGSGSIKKVLLGTLLDGRKVAIKYIDQDFKRKITHSLEVIQGAVRRLEKWRDRFPDLPLLGSILAAVEKDIQKELNLPNEHDSYRNLKGKLMERKDHLGSDYVLVPSTHDELGLPPANGNVIVEQAFELIPLSDESTLKAHGVDAKQMVKNHIVEQLEELLIDGFFDYDTRPANWRPVAGPDGIRLGYYDKAQGIQLNAQELAGLREMLIAMTMKNEQQFVTAFKKFEDHTKLPADTQLKSMAKDALQKNNPYEILQAVTFALEKSGTPMSESHVLKLSMWLRQLDRHLEMVPEFKIKAELMRIYMRAGSL
jgi:predicted unusual protein kinase regulating ubiquinone biosynthesis (AarF/ABC1/UbiB family)